MAGILMRCTYIYIYACVCQRQKATCYPISWFFFGLYPRVHDVIANCHDVTCRFIGCAASKSCSTKKDGWKPIFNGMFTSVFNCRISQPSIVASSLSVCVCKILQVLEKIIMQPILRKWTWTLLPHPTPPMWHDNKKWRVAGVWENVQKHGPAGCTMLRPWPGAGTSPSLWMQQVHGWSTDHRPTDS